MAQGTKDGKKPTPLWIVLIAALAILLVGWLVYTAIGPDGTPGELDTVEAGSAPVAQPVERADPDAVDVDLPEVQVDKEGMEKLRSVETKDNPSQ